MIIMRQQVRKLISVDEYLSIEQMSNIKHEYDAGEIYAMSGGSARHNEITLNVYALLRQALDGTACRAYVADLRLRTPSGLYAYPDVMVICGELQVTGERPETVQNPVVLVEILSETTARYDRTRKFEHYRSIATLRDYLLVEQDTVDVQHHSLRGDLWVPERWMGLDESVRLHGLDVALPLREIYQ